MADLDFPTAWALQRAGGLEHDERCSAAVTSGAVLCDCGAVQRKWDAFVAGGVRRLVERIKEEDGHGQDTDPSPAREEEP